MIAINGRFLSQPVTGVQRYARELTNALGAIRDDLVMLVPPRTPAATSPRVPLRTVGRNQGHLWEQVDLPLHLYTHRDYDLLLSFSATGPLLYRRQISTHHDVTFLRYPESFSRSFRSLYRLTSPLMMHKNRRAITVSEFSRAELSRHFRVPQRKTCVVPNAPAPAFTHPTQIAVPEKDGLLAVSSSSAHKNLTALTAAMRILSNEFPRLRLRVVGDRAVQDEAELPNIDYLGFVDDDRLAHLYESSTALIIPSFYEGFGLPAIEAQASGCPVISSDIPALREVLRSSASFVDPRSTAAIVGAIRDLVTSPSEQARLSRLGVANARRFSWEGSATVLHQLIDTESPRRPTPDDSECGQHCPASTRPPAPPRTS